MRFQRVPWLWRGRPGASWRRSALNVTSSSGATLAGIRPAARFVRAPVRMAVDRRQTVGLRGEDLACEELRRRGYEILARRYRSRQGEIDIVARDGDVVVFIEVKARVGKDFGDGAAAVTPWKQRQIAKLAVDFLARYRLHDRPCRFDVVAVDMTREVPAIQLYPAAFDSFD